MKPVLSMAAAVMAAGLVLASCTDAVDPRVPSTLEVSPTSADLMVGETLDLEVTVVDQHGDAFTTLPEGVTVELASSDPAVATVTGTQITAVGQGNATVTVTAGDATPVDVQVSVDPAPGSLQVSQTEVSLGIDDTRELSAVILDEDGNEMSAVPPGYEIEAESANPNVVVVDGLTLQGVSEGTTTVEVTAGDLTPVTVQVEVRDADLSGSMSLEFSGDTQGSFDFDEQFDFADLFDDDRTWAATVFDPDFNSQDIMAWRANADGTVDVAMFWADGGPVGSPEERPMQPEGFIILGFDTSASTATHFVEIDAGVIEFTDVSQTRLGGVFEAEGVNGFTGGEVTVQNGTFDLPIIDLNSFSAFGTEDLREAARDLARDLRARL